MAGETKLFFKRKRLLIITVVCFSLLVVAGLYLFIQKHNTDSVGDTEKQQLTKEVIEHPEIEKYKSSLRIFDNLEGAAMVPYDDTLSEEIKLDALERYSRPKWLQAYNAVKNIDTRKLSDDMKAYTLLLRKYASQRVHEIDLMKRIHKGDGKATRLLNDIQDSINTSLAAIGN